MKTSYPIANLLCFLLTVVVVSRIVQTAPTYERIFTEVDRNVVERSLDVSRRIIKEATFRSNNVSSFTVRTTSPNPDPDHIKISGNGKRVTLDPHGLEETHPPRDTVNLQWVFDNYPSADIKLSAGVFHIGEMIEAVNYQGKIKGEGTQRTFLVGRGPLVGSDYVFPLLTSELTERLYPTSVPHLIWFHPAVYEDPEEWTVNQIDLEMKDLTIRLEGVGPEITFFGQPLRSIWSLVIFTAPLATETALGSVVPRLSATFKNVHFEAGMTPYEMNGENREHANAAAAILFYGGELWVSGPGLNFMTEELHSPINAQLEIADCRFSDFHQFAMAIEGIFTSDAMTGYAFPTTNPFPPSAVEIRDNVFTDIGGGAGVQGGEGFTIVILGTSDTTYDIKDNVFENIPALGIAFLSFIAEVLPKSTAHINVKDNEFHHLGLPSARASLLLLDFGFSFTGHYQVTVKDNLFEAPQQGYSSNFIELASGTGTLIKDNKFVGRSLAGISVGNLPNPFCGSDVCPNLPVLSVSAKDNTFSHLQTELAPILLGTGSSNCVMRVEDAAQVLNLADPENGNQIIVD